MLTIFFLLSQARGAGWLFAWYFLCLGAASGMYLIKKSRRASCRRALLGWLGCEALCDAVWLTYFFDGADYVNHGLGGTLPMLLLWPALLLAAFFILWGMDEKDKKINEKR